MSHSLTKIWIHAVWSTKKRVPMLHQNIEEQVFQFISDQLQQLGCTVCIINGMPDHIHCLFRLNSQKSIAEVIKQIKGSSSFYMNQNQIISEKFAWQTGYAAFSVSESGVKKVYEYIKNQKIHHQKNNFDDEFNAFVQLYGLDLNEPTTIK